MQHAVPETFEPSSAAHRSSVDRARSAAIPLGEVWPEAAGKAPGVDDPTEWLAGRFKLGARLGRGGIAEVFAATDMRDGRRVAVKVLPPYGRHAAVTPERVEAEMTLGRRVEHANLCHVLESGHAEDGSPYLVTEALTGETLGHCLRRRGKVSVDAALRLTLEAARGLGALHRAGIVHRDVKPDNLFLCDTKAHDAAVKVIDLGFAALSGTASPDPLRIFGTLRYTAPEQAIGEAVDERADVYSLGVVLFRAITGELPFDACADREIILHHVHSPIPPPSWFTDGVPPEVDAVVAGAVMKHPENRYPSMAAFCDDLDRALTGVPTEGPPLVVVPDWFEPATELGRKVVRVLGSSWAAREAG